MTVHPPPQDHLSTLESIRTLMERSSRFISLSGLSGVAAGLFALAGAAAVFFYLGIEPFEGKRLAYFEVQTAGRWGLTYEVFLLLVASMVLIGAVASGIFFTTRKARRRGQPVWGPLTRRLLINLAIPLVTGGVFILALYYHRVIGLIAPATLIFYGLALINGSKYTLNDIRYLGAMEIVLGLIGVFFPGFGLELWAIGFGVLHILYGAMMWNRYERAPGKVGA
jgi:hypothetical protein